MSRNDLPGPSAPNFPQRLREAVMTYLGRTGDPLDRGITLRDLIEGGFARLRDGYTAGQAAASGGALPIAPEVVAEEPDLTPPPTPTGFTASAAISHVFIEHDAPLYTQGHGHLRTRVYGKTVAAGDPLPVFADAVEITQFTGAVHAHPSNPSTIWRLWIKWESADGVLSVSPAGGTNGVQVVTGQDVSSMVAAMTGAGKPFTVLTEPTVIGGVTLPAGIYSTLAFIQDAQITSAKIANLAVDDAKIASLSAAKITTGFLSADRIQSGSLDAKIANIDAAVIGSGFIAIARIADASIIGAKIADAAIATANIADAAITAAKIADAQITTAKIANAAITAAKIGDAEITNAKIGAAAVDTLKLAGQAVTIPSSAYTASDSVFTTGSVWHDVQSLSYTSTGAPTLVAFSFTYNGTGTGSNSLMDIRVTRDGTEIYFAKVSLGENLPLSGSILDTFTTAAARTYKVQLNVQTSFGTMTVSYRALTALEVKR